MTNINCLVLTCTATETPQNLASLCRIWWQYHCLGFYEHPMFLLQLPSAVARPDLLSFSVLRYETCTCQFEQLKSLKLQYVITQFKLN